MGKSFKEMLSEIKGKIKEVSPEELKQRLINGKETINENNIAMPSFSEIRPITMPIKLLRNATRASICNTSKNDMLYVEPYIRNIRSIIMNCAAVTAKKKTSLASMYNTGDVDAFTLIRKFVFLS